jgi:hypothetical protein
MKYFNMEFEYKTRPWFRKGRLKREWQTFAAPDLAEAYRQAGKWGEEHYGRRHWALTGKWSESNTY